MTSGVSLTCWAGATKLVTEATIKSIERTLKPRESVAESVTEVSGGLSGVRIAEAGLTELVPSLGHRVSDWNSGSYTGTSLFPSFTIVSTIYCR